MMLRVFYRIWKDELSHRQQIMTGIGLILVIGMIFLAIFGSFLLPYDPNSIDLAMRFLPPSYVHPFGTDYFGRDILSRTIAGARTSFTAATLAITVTLVIATPLGLFAGYLGGKLDRSLTFMMDSLYAFPKVVIAILIASLLGQELYFIALAVGIASIPSFYRVVNSIVISAKERTFVEASRSMGASASHIIRDCIVPQVLPSITALGALTYGSAILVVAALGFLGVGIPPPTPEWGTDLAVSREFLPLGAWWQIVFPGLAIVLGTWGFVTIGETINDFVNPRLRKR